MSSRRVSPRRLRRTRRGERGVTLIELMIVIAIIGILAAISYPSYLDYVRATRRADAMIHLAQAIQAVKRYRTENGTYAGFSLNTHVPGVSPEGHYFLTYINDVGTTDENVGFVAQPSGDQVGDAACPYFILTTTGARDAVKAPEIPGCWKD